MVKLVVTDKDGRDVEVDARPGLSIMENIRQLPRSVEAVCGGLCSCATCHVFIDEESMRAFTAAPLRGARHARHVPLVRSAALAPELPDQGDRRSSKGLR